MVLIVVVVVVVFVVVVIVVGESLETKVPTIWTDKKHSQEEAQAWRKSEGIR